MDFNKFKIQIADGSTQYRGLSLAEIIEMGFRNYYLYITKYHKRKLTKKRLCKNLIIISSWRKSGIQVKLNNSVCNTCDFFDHECDYENGCVEQCNNPDENVQRAFYENDDIKKCAGYK